jgi:cysteine-rich repeat protein
MLSRRSSRFALWVVLALAQCKDGGGGGGGEGGSDTTSSGTAADESSSESGAPTPCGNGAMDDGEECDDGNDVNGDGCNVDCKASQQVVWADAIDGGVGDDCAEGVETDAEGNIVAVGFVAVEGGSSDIWVHKRNGDGGEIWTQTSNGPASGNDRARGIAIDHAGSIVVTGYVQGPPEEGTNLWIRMYYADGSVAWTQVVDPMGFDDSGYDVVALAGGDGFVVAGEVGNEGNDTDAWIRKVDATSGEEVWTVTNVGDAGTFDSARGVGVTSSGTLVVAGWQTTMAAGREAWVRGLDAEGAELWTKTFNAGSSSGNQGNAVDLVPDDTAIVTGSQREGQASTDIWTQAYDAAGNETWGAVFGSLDDQPDTGRAVAAGSDGTAAIVGSFIEDGFTKMRLQKYDAAGMLQWSQAFTGVTQMEAEGYGVATDPADQLAIVGCEFDPLVDGSADTVIAKMTP